MILKYFSIIFLRSSLLNINSAIQNSSNIQHSKEIYNSKLSSTFTSTINSSKKRNIEELKIETQNNKGKLIFLFTYKYVNLILLFIF